MKAETSLEELSTSLTHTRAWLALVSGQVPQLAQHLQPLTDFAADQNRIQAAANAATTSAGKSIALKSVCYVTLMRIYQLLSRVCLCFPIFAGCQYCFNSSATGTAALCA